MKEKKELSVGDILYRKTLRVGASLEEISITKVGKKYYYAGSRDYKIDKETLKYSGESYPGSAFQCYIDPQDYYNQIRLSEMERKISMLFKGYGTPGISQEDMESIYIIVQKYFKE